MKIVIKKKIHEAPISGDDPSSWDIGEPTKPGYGKAARTSAEVVEKEFDPGSALMELSVADNALTVLLEVVDISEEFKKEILAAQEIIELYKRYISGLHQGNSLEENYDINKLMASFQHKGSIIDKITSSIQAIDGSPFKDKVFTPDGKTLNVLKPMLEKIKKKILSSGGLISIKGGQDMRAMIGLGGLKEVVKESIQEVILFETELGHDTAELEDGTPVCEACLYEAMTCGCPDTLEEAKYHGRSVPLGKPMRGDVKKFKVFVRDPSTGNIKKVNFGDPNMRIKKSNPKRRKSFRARHNCDNPGPRTKARYWSCRKW